MTTKKKNIIYTCVVIPVAVANGIVGGVTSVITAYFFRPLWNHITKLWEKTNDSKVD